MKPVITPSSSTESVNKVPVVKAKATHIIMNSLITSKNLPLTLSCVGWALGDALVMSQGSSWRTLGFRLALCWCYVGLFSSEDISRRKQGTGE